MINVIFVTLINTRHFLLFEIVLGCVRFGLIFSRRSMLNMNFHLNLDELEKKKNFYV